MKTNYFTLRVSVMILAISPAIFAVDKEAIDWGYDTFVEPVRQAKWLEKVYMTEPAYLAFYEGDEVKRLRPWAQKMKEAGFNLAAMYNDGFCRLYDSTEQVNWSDACRKEVRIMHSLGVKVIAGAYPFVGKRGPRDILNEHPEWRKRYTDKVPEGPGLGCMLNPEFAAELRKILVRRIEEFDIDGWQFDGWYQREYCCCPSCKKIYKQETGKDVPGRVDITDVNYIKYMTWRDKKLLDQLVLLRKAVKAVKPDAVLVNWNNNDCAGATPSSMPEALNCIADWTNKEWWDGFDVFSIWLNRRLRGSSGDDRVHAMQPYMFMRWDKDINSGVYHGSSTPMTEVLYRTHEIMANGSIPIVWSGMRAGWNPDVDWPILNNAVLEFLPLVHQTRTLKYAVCIDSYTTLQNCGRRVTNRAFHEGSGKEANEVVGYSRGGTARILLEEQIPFDVISEHNVSKEKLQQYKVVILPNNMCMTERIAEVLRDYVDSGGGLVAAYEASLYDRWGQKRNNYLLSNLFNADYVDSIPVGPSRIMIKDGKNPVLKDDYLLDLIGNKPSTYWGKYANVVSHSGAVVPLGAIDVNRLDKNKKSEWTPMILSQKGHGRVAFFPASINSAYYDAGYPYQRLIYANAVKWAANSEIPVKVSAPKCITSRFLTRNLICNKQRTNKKTVIVHLLNGINTTTGHGSVNEKEVAMREEIIEVSGIKISFVSKKPDKVTMIPGKQQLLVVPVEGRWQVTLPPVGIHAAVQAEYH